MRGNILKMMDETVVDQGVLDATPSNLTKWAEQRTGDINAAASQGLTD